MKQRSRRLGRVMRWGLAVATLLCFGLVPLSWYRVIGYGQTTVDPATWSRTSFGIDRGMIWLSRTPECRSCWGSKPAESSRKVFSYPAQNELTMDFFDMRRGLGGKLVIGSTAGTEYVYSASLWIPSTMLLCAAALIWWPVRKRQKSGLCSSCGYSLEGLTISVCPECGVEHG